MKPTFHAPVQWDVQRCIQQDSDELDAQLPISVCVHWVAKMLGKLSVLYWMQLGVFFTHIFTDLHLNVVHVW